MVLLAQPCRLRPREIEFLGILLDHPVRVEEGGDGPHRLLGHPDPSFRIPLPVPLIIKRGNLVLQKVVERFRVVPVLDQGVLMVPLPPDHPAVSRLVPLAPPSIQNAQVDPAVEGRLHPAGPAGLVGAPGGVEPDVHPGDQVAGEAHVVPLEEDDLPPEPRVMGHLMDLADQVLPRLVGRMGLPGKDDLDRLPLPVENPGQPIHVLEDQRGPFVGGEPPSESDGEGLRIQEPVHPPHLPSRSPVP